MIEMTYAADNPIIGGVISPITTAACVRNSITYMWRIVLNKLTSRNNANQVSISLSDGHEASHMISQTDSQLFTQLEAVERDTPLLRMDSGKTSLGRIQPMGPKLTPYAAVKVYMHL